MEDNFFEMPIDMNKSLAEIMDSTDKSRIFLTSDWHVMKYKYQKGRNYVNTNEIVKWCKDNIKSNDIFIYLGDLCYRYANKEDSKKAQEIYKSLPGIKILILGNHDIHQGEDFYNNCGFDYVFTEFEYHDIVFTHRPINMIMRGNLSGLNIHGHIHELTNDYDFLDPSRNINVYPNNYGNKPTTLKYILNHINKLTKDNKPNNTTDLSDGLTESSRIIRDYLGSQLDDSNIMNENYNVKKSRQFIMQVDKLAKKYGVNYFIVTDGASKIHNNGNPAVKHARDEHIKWELDNNSDPYEDWLNESSRIIKDYLGPQLDDNNMGIYYRVESNGTGIYEAFKKIAGKNKWHEVLKASKWLPKPPNYKNGYASYFTKKGFEKFLIHVFPIMKDSLNDITIHQYYSVPGKIIYKDRYQIVVLK